MNFSRFEFGSTVIRPSFSEQVARVDDQLNFLSIPMQPTAVSALPLKADNITPVNQFVIPYLIIQTQPTCLQFVWLSPIEPINHDPIHSLQSFSLRLLKPFDFSGQEYEQDR